MSEQLAVQELLPFLKLGEGKIRVGGETEKGEINFLDFLLMELTGEKKEEALGVFPSQLEKSKSFSKDGIDEIKVCKNHEKNIEKSKLEDFLPFIVEDVVFLLSNIPEQKIQLDVGQVEEKLKSVLQNLMKNGTHGFSEIAKKISEFLRENFHIQLSPKDIETQMRIAIEKSTKTPVSKDLMEENFPVENKTEPESKVFKPKMFMRMNPIQGETKEEKTTENRFDLKQEFTLLENKGKFFEGLKKEPAHKTNESINKLFQQVVDSVFAAKIKGLSSVTVHLKPEVLGKLQINLRSIDGSVVATIITESEKTKHQIESNLSLLQAQLDLKGIKIESVNVTVDRNFQFTYQYTGEGNYQKYSHGDNDDTSGFRRFASRSYLMTEEVEPFSQGISLKDGHLDLKA
ncbi:flagellar hook-length control protein FliK [Caldanaerobacter sp.]|uniref:flagellar hook-length control protein FliK n=1 Tax=Caldanaerobacter sp. TaxID=2930036 RepID=UPI003C792ED4